MTDKNTTPDDVFDFTEYMPKAIQLWATKFPGIFGSAMAEDLSITARMAQGGKSITVPTVNFVDSDGNTAQFKKFTGSALATNGGVMTAEEFPLETYGLPIKIVGTTIDQAWRSADGETIIDQFTTMCGEKMAEAIDKHLIETIIASGQRYFRKSADTKLANALLGARGVFGDRQLSVKNLVVNGAGSSALIAEHLSASDTGAPTLLDGNITKYLGCNVVLSDNVADNHAIMGLDKAIKFAVKNVKMHYVPLAGQTHQYEVYFSIAAFIPSPNGMKGVVYADIGTPPAVLKTTLTPAGAVTAGAKWSIDGGTTWLDSAASANVTGNTATIKFKATTGYATPADKVLTNLQNGVTTEVSQAYTAS